MNSAEAHLTEKTNLSITVISKTGCHLCDHTIKILEMLKGKYEFELSILDIESDSALFDKYWVKVPVIRANDVDVYEAEDLARLNEWRTKLEMLVSTQRNLDSLR
jgi:glutaredoxin